MSPVIKPFLHDPMEEIAYGPSAWLWDYLRRSCSIDLLGSMVVGVYDLRASKTGPVGCQK